MGQTHRLIWIHNNNFVYQHIMSTKCKTLLSSAQFCSCAGLCGDVGAEPVAGASSEDFWSEGGSGAHPSISHSLSKTQWYLTVQSCKNSNSSTIKQRGNYTPKHGKLRIEKFFKIRNLFLCCSGYEKEATGERQKSGKREHIKTISPLPKSNKHEYSGTRQQKIRLGQ